MTDKLFINNRTDKPMLATITDNYTGSNVFTCELVPGSNELSVEQLEAGVYMIQLEDSNHDIFYQQKLFKD